MYGVRPYPGALGVVAPQPFRPGDRLNYRMRGLGDGEETQVVSNEEHAAIMLATLNEGVAVAGALSSAIGGALIGGLASAKWSGAGTGALVSGGLAAAAGGLGASATSAATGTSPAPGAIIALSGVGMLGWGLWRWNKLRKGR